jgi:transposase
MVYQFEKKVMTKYGTYTYICIGEAERINGRSVRTWEFTLGRKDRMKEDIQNLKRKLSRKSPDGQEYQFGLVEALASIAQDIDLMGAINQHVDKRDQGISVGEYITTLAINRAVSLNSKSQAMDWFATTTLYRQFPGIADELTVQNIWNQMGYLDQDNIRKIEQTICKAVLTIFALKPDCFLYDPTNFYTYIRDYKKNTIAQHGHNKKKRNELRQVNMSLLVARGETPVPMLHETYEGNVCDVTHFKDMLATMKTRLAAIGIDAATITLIFDKGNNSPDNFKKLDEENVHFITSLRPSTCQSLVKVPLSAYEVLWTKKPKNDVLGYRTMTTRYIGKESTIVVTFDKDTFALQKHKLDEHVKKAESRLWSFVTLKLNTKPQWSDIKKVTSKIKRDILKTRELRAIITFTVTNKKDGAGVDVTWHVDDKAKGAWMQRLGKTYIMTNMNEWSTTDIARTYRMQHDIEDRFKELNERDAVSVMPMYHWTDQKIRAHVFISVLALLLRSLLHAKIRSGGIMESKNKCFNALKGMKEIHLQYKDGNPPEIIYTSKSLLQKKLYDLLDLERFSNAR